MTVALTFTSPAGSLACSVDYAEVRSGEDGRLLAHSALVRLSSAGAWAPGWLEVCAEALRQVPFSRAYGFRYRVDASAAHGDASRLEREFRAIANKYLTA